MLLNFSRHTGVAVTAGAVNAGDVFCGVVLCGDREVDVVGVGEKPTVDVVIAEDTTFLRRCSVGCDGVVVVVVVAAADDEDDDVSPPAVVLGGVFSSDPSRSTATRVPKHCVNSCKNDICTRVGNDKLWWAGCCSRLLPADVRQTQRAIDSALQDR
jgi:hypothetical protein